MPDDQVAAYLAEVQKDVRAAEVAGLLGENAHTGFLAARLARNNARLLAAVEFALGVVAKWEAFGDEGDRVRAAELRPMTSILLGGDPGA